MLKILLHVFRFVVCSIAVGTIRIVADRCVSQDARSAIAPRVAGETIASPYAAIMFGSALERRACLSHLDMVAAGSEPKERVIDQIIPDAHSAAPTLLRVSHIRHPAIQRCRPHACFGLAHRAFPLVFRSV
ncbi:hypothetical protein [Burkholderia ubonensis]|uniref:hypothetical protein n=1 Tax=Burkholderia ubonensis TaxID=101571 RepID=UPI00116144D5|nr:hypothetical protein [Burkholderia ubonensis]